MSSFRNAVVSLPGKERVARTPFGARIVIHATAAETGGALGMWETFTPTGHGPPRTRIRGRRKSFGSSAGSIDSNAATRRSTRLWEPSSFCRPHVPHSWRNIGDEPGQMFGTVTPGGCEQLFIDIEAFGADTPEKIAVIEARLGIINDITLALGLTGLQPR
ncbi:hypothetical protein ACVMH6_002833 [Rhizobium leguminosarum]